MNRKLLLLLVLVLAQSVWAADIDLRELMNGGYRANRMSEATPMADGKTFARMSDDGARVEVCSFETGKAVRTLFDAATARGHKLERIEGFIVSPDESRLLIQTNTQSIYRHSFSAEYYIYSVRNNTLEPLSTAGPQQQPLFSPDGNYIAFGRDNDLYIVKLLFDNSESRVTKDGKRGEIINGLPDWVNEEEFSTSRSFAFSADGKMLAWVRYDESRVPLYSIPRYDFPTTDGTTAQAPTAFTYKFALAGGANSRVSVHSFDIKAGVTRTIGVPLDEDSYVPRIFFSENPDQLIIATLNRDQNRFDVYAADARSTVARLVMREESDRYIPEEAYSNMHTFGSNLITVSDRSGYNQIYICPLSGGTPTALTTARPGVISVYGYKPASGLIYYEAYDESPLRSAVFATDLKGKTRRLTDKRGTNRAIVSSTGAYYMVEHSSLAKAPTVAAYSASGKQTAVIETNSALQSKLDAVRTTKELFTFTTPEGTELNGWIVKPEGFDPSRKYPVVMYQYSGPGSQEVLDGWRSGMLGGLTYESHLASLGFVVVCVDGRGTGGRGADFEKATYLRLGLIESQDQVYTAKYLASLPYVDASRIGLWGWSYGGFNTLMSMSDGSSTFRAGVAVAALSTWKFYDTIYTERYMRRPSQNATGYADNPLARADKLSGSLLLIHGTADDNVHLSNALVYAEALTRAGKQFDMQLYTNRDHSIYGNGARLHLFTRITDFFVRELQPQK